MGVVGGSAKEKVEQTRIVLGLHEIDMVLRQYKVISEITHYKDFYSSLRLQPSESCLKLCSAPWRTIFVRLMWRSGNEETKPLLRYRDRSRHRCLLNRRHMSLDSLCTLELPPGSDDYTNPFNQVSSSQAQCHIPLFKLCLVVYLATFSKSPRPHGTGRQGR
jgi:hypothetical protein